MRLLAAGYATGSLPNDRYWEKRTRKDQTATHVTVSAGIATYPGSSEIDSMDALVRAADGALYRAKDAGKDCVVQFASEVSGRT